MRELSLHILDIVQNSLEAGANLIEIEIDEDAARNRLVIRVTDNGRGMDAQTVQHATDPFFTTRHTRHVGLGLPLFKAAAERCNGGLAITSQVGVGTRVVAEFERDHLDRAPLGDMPSILLGLVLSQKRELRFCHRFDERVFELDTRELRAILGDVPLDHPQVRVWLEDYLVAGYAELYAKPHVPRAAS